MVKEIPKGFTVFVTNNFGDFDVFFSRTESEEVRIGKGERTDSTRVEIGRSKAWLDEKGGIGVYFEARQIQPHKDKEGAMQLTCQMPWSKLGDERLNYKITSLDKGEIPEDRYLSEGVFVEDKNLVLTRCGLAVVVFTEKTVIDPDRKKKIPSARVTFEVI